MGPELTRKTPRLGICASTRSWKSFFHFRTLDDWIGGSGEHANEPPQRLGGRRQKRVAKYAWVLSGAEGEQSITTKEQELWFLN